MRRNITAMSMASGLGSVVTGTIYALVDGVIGGAIFRWLYDLFAARKADSRRVRRNSARRGNSSPVLARTRNGPHSRNGTYGISPVAGELFRLRARKFYD